jgi:aminopeptidase N
MKQLLFTITFILISFFSFSQINDDFNFEHTCAHGKAHNHNDFSRYLYNWQSDYLNDYDVTFYLLDMEVSNTSLFLDGNTTINGIALVDLDTFAIELQSYQTITKIMFNGVEYTDYYRDESNVIVPVDEVTTGSSFSAQVFYNGEPPTGGFFSGLSHATSTLYGKEVVWTLSEPFAAADWFAVKQDLEDKADSVWVFLTTSSDNMAGSQGILTDVVDLGDNKSRYEWKSNYPIAYYLISFAVSDYQDYSIYAHPEELVDDSILVQNFIYDTPECLNNNMAAINETVPMIELFSDKYILYPFWEEKYGHCLTELGGGMEHQTMTTIGGFSFGLVAHELGHMWFGDNVTCATWSDIWINEGFATYSNSLAEEFINGAASGQSFIKGAQDFAISAPGGSVYIPIDQIFPGNEGRIFSGRLSYNKGAAIIHTLRHEIQNDDLFFEVLETFQTDFTDSTATGEDFKNTAEVVTGMDFEQFFDQWYYGEGYPIYNIEYYNLDGINYLSSLQSTSSSTPFFDMIMEYRVYFDDATDTLISFHQDAHLVEFTIESGKNIAYIDVDPFDWNMEYVASITVGVTEKLSPATFKLGQNSKSNNITLYFTEGEFINRDITITDISGKVVFNGHSDNNAYNINTSFLTNGIYIVKASDGENTFVARFIK